VVDVDWYYAPSPDAAEAAITAAAGTDAKVLFDVLEAYHGTQLDRWVFGRKATLVRKYVHRRITRVCVQSDLVMAVSDSIMRHYAADLPHTVVVRNCAPRWFADGPVAVGGLIKGEALRVLHGKTHPNNGTSVVLEALAELSTDKVVQVVMFPWLRKAEASFMVDFEQQVEHLGVNNKIDLRDSVGHSEMPAIMRTCNVGMIAYGRGLGEDSLPNRLFEYMAAGLAVLTPTYSIEIRNIVEAEQIGLSIDTERPEEISRAISWFSEHPVETREMGLKAREAFLRRHSWDAEFDRLVQAMNRVEAGK
jgi:glycosyltransferase involved in cell wall biosynthesis